MAVFNVTPTQTTFTVTVGENTAAAAASATSAQEAAQIAQAVNGPLYANTAAGLAATSNNEEFAVLNANGTATIYVNSNGSAVERRTIVINPSNVSTAGLLGYSTSSSYGAGTVGDAITPSVTLAALPGVPPKAGKAVFIQDVWRAGVFICRSGSAPSDPQNGIYVSSNTSGFYWERLWDGVHGRPEWFGLIPNNSAAAAANLTALNACIVLCPVTQLGNADYWVNGRVDQQTPYRTIQGHRGDGYNTGTGTRLYSTNLSVPVLRQGPNSQPGSLAAHMRGIVLRDVTLGHVGNYTGPTSGNEATAVPVLDRRWLIKAVCERVNLWEPLIGVYSHGLVQCYTVNSKVLRTEPKVSSGVDFCWANFVDGNPPAPGLPGNPSYYEDTFSAEFNPELAVDKVGILCTADFSDVFIDGAETSNATSGIRLSGSGTKAQINVHLRNCIFDQCAGTALDIQGLAAGACVNIEGGYYQANDTALAVIHVRGTNGTVNITGGCQIVGGQEGDIIGIYAQGQKQVNVAAGVTILEVPRPIVLEGATGAQLMCSVQNDTVGDGTQHIVGTTASDGVVIAIQARGKNDAFARGIDLVGTSNTRVSIDPTLIDRNIISGGAANLIYADPFGTPVPLTAPGYYTSAGASGTSGAGIFVTGITA